MLKPQLIPLLTLTSICTWSEESTPQAHSILFGNYMHPMGFKGAISNTPRGGHYRDIIKLCDKNIG
jgi:hypothetical protein